MSAPPPDASVAAGGGGGPEPGLSVAAVPGRLSSAYDVQKAVGKGGYAIVYKGIRREDGRVVAVKKVEIFEMTQKKRDRCLQEVQLLKQLSHPYIIQMLDAFIDENMLIIIFEWAPAGDLKRLIKKTSEAGKTLDETSIWNFFSQITDALRYMHQHRIMHRDIKPANVLVGANGALKIGDLGLGRQLSEQTMEAFSKVGTPYYVSPEVVRGAGYDWKSDVWSLGCLLYELACLHSPFEMEGANLYDVFQKISKGDYPPLPADMFSAPLRSLTVRMLSVDPAKRPELEEVWNITQKVTQAQQTKGRTDVHSASEDLCSQLLLLEADVVHKLSRQNGKRVELPLPPLDVLRSLHPLFFAEPLAPPASPHADMEQKRQLGAVMAIFSWLLKLLGQNDMAHGLEGLLEDVPAPRSSTGHRRGPQPPAIKRTTSSSSQRGRVNRLGTPPGGSPPGGRPTSGGSSSGSPQVSIPCTGLVSSCNNVLKGAEAVKKAAQVVGLSTEFAPVNAVATGHGRAVCAMLQDMIDVTWSKIQPAARRPRYREEEAHEILEDEDVDTLGIDDWGGACVIDSSHPLPGISRGGGLDEDEDEEYLPQHGIDNIAGLGPRPLSQSASSAGRGSGVGGNGAPGRGTGPGRPKASLESQQVDPVKWRAELERLIPQLSHIRLPPGSSSAESWGNWHHRLVHELKGAAVGLVGPTVGVSAALSRTSADLSNDLERIQASERRLNANAEALTREYRLAKQRMDEMQRHVLGQQELESMGNSAMAELTARLEEVGIEMQDRAGGLDGGVKIQSIQAAMRRLRDEMRGMDLRIGVVQQQLLSQQRKSMQSQRANLEDED